MSPRSDAETTTLTRREFTLEAALALLSTVVITVSGCDDSPTTPSTAPGNVTGTISANHGHTAVIDSARISAGTAFSLDIRGTATHPHTVQITQADLMALQNRQTVNKTSTTDDGHSHTVNFTP